MTDRCLDSHCEHPDHRDSKPPGAATDPLDTVPAEERRRIRNLAREERRAAPWAGKLVEEKAIAREVADYHERTGLRTVVADKAAQVSEDVIGQALTIASGAQAVESLTPPGREDERADAVRRAFESALTDDPTMLSRAWQAVTFAADVTRETYPSSPARRRLVEEELRRAPADRTPLFWPALPEAHRRTIALEGNAYRDRGAPAPGDVVISRAILERLTKAAASDSDAREARWAAERILQRATLAAEPARTDPLFARVIAEATQHDARLVPPAPDLSDLAAGKARGLVRSGASSADLLDRLTSEAIPRLAVEATAADPDRSRLRAAVSDAAGIVLAIATLRGGQ